MQIRASAPSKAAFRRDLYIAQEDDGLPGRGSMSVLGECFLHKRAGYPDGMVIGSGSASVMGDSRLGG